MTSERGTSAPPATRASDPIRFEFAAHNCFACGTLNANGLGLVLHVEPDRCWAELELDRRFEGWEGIAHGGITCTILDEVMAWSLVGGDNGGLTAPLAVELRRPISIGAPIRAVGWVTGSRRRVVHTAARLVDLDSGAELATATGVYVGADAARKVELEARYGFRRLDADPAGVTR